MADIHVLTSLSPIQAHRFSWLKFDNSFSFLNVSSSPEPMSDSVKGMCARANSQCILMHKFAITVSFKPVKCAMLNETLGCSISDSSKIISNNLNSFFNPYFLQEAHEVKEKDRGGEDKKNTVLKPNSSSVTLDSQRISEFGFPQQVPYQVYVGTISLNAPAGLPQLFASVFCLIFSRTILRIQRWFSGS